MATKKQLAIKFTRVDKSRTKTKAGHTRTGACTSSGRCYHGWTHRIKK